MDQEQFFIHTDDQEIAAQKDATLMEAMISAGLLLRSDCGGRGRCGKCLVRVSGQDMLSRPDDDEVRSLGENRLKAGERLACRTKPLGNVILEIPEESRLRAEVVQKGLPVLFSRLESLDGPLSTAPGQGYGIALDVGTTTIAVYLGDLAKGALVSSTSVRNPQAVFGDDVISRIAAARDSYNGLARLQRIVVSAIEWAVSELCRQAGIDPHMILSMVAVGNSTMMHLLLGEDPSSIGIYPFTPKFSEERSLLAADIGLKFNPRASLRTLPLISAYLGADILGAALAASLPHAPPGTLLIDVGTNGEIMLSTEDGLIGTSCATGPAFEGATIEHGMQATSGAIDAVRFDSRSGSLDYTLIQRDSKRPKRASGICGSGVVSVVAELLRAGVLTKSGSFDPHCGSPCLRPGVNGVLEFEIAPPEASQNGRAITFTQTDVRAVQLAKGALRTGIDLLCREDKRKRPQKLLLAGAFGSYIHKSDALQIGMFPDMTEDEIEIVGNAAGAGAVITLFQEGRFAECRKIAGTTRIFNLATHPDFQNTFLRSLSF